MPGGYRNETFYPPVCYTITIILGLLILAFTVTDLITSSVADQISGNTTTFSKNVYIALISTFYVMGILYAVVHWFFTYEDASMTQREPSSRDQSIFRQNMTWNLTTFFITSFMFFLYTIISVLDFIFVFSVVFSIQVCCCGCLVILSLSKEYPGNKLEEYR